MGTTRNDQKIRKNFFVPMAKMVDCKLLLYHLLFNYDASLVFLPMGQACLQFMQQILPDILIRVREDCKVEQYTGFYLFYFALICLKVYTSKKVYNIHHERCSFQMNMSHDFTIKYTSWGVVRTSIPYSLTGAWALFPTQPSRIVQLVLLQGCHVRKLV